MLHLAANSRFPSFSSLMPPSPPDSRLATVERTHSSMQAFSLSAASAAFRRCRASFLECPFVVSRQQLQLLCPDTNPHRRMAVERPRNPWIFFLNASTLPPGSSPCVGPPHRNAYAPSDRPLQACFRPPGV